MMAEDPTVFDEVRCFAYAARLNIPVSLWLPETGLGMAVTAAGRDTRVGWCARDALDRGRPRVRRRAFGDNAARTGLESSRAQLRSCLAPCRRRRGTVHGSCPAARWRSGCGRRRRHLPRPHGQRLARHDQRESSHLAAQVRSPRAARTDSASGQLLIAEVTSRIADLKALVRAIEQVGFKVDKQARRAARYRR